MSQPQHPRPPQETLPTMYDLPSERIGEPGLPDEFHRLQAELLSQTCVPPSRPLEEVFVASDLNLYYNCRHPGWYKRPDWFLVMGVPRYNEQEKLRLSYVTWQEGVAPFLVVELLSPGTEREDLGQKPRVKRLLAPNKPPSKWQVYEQLLRIPYYVVYDRYENNLRCFRLEGASYRALSLPEEKFWLPDLQLGLGVWEGSFEGTTGLWLRWYDAEDNWLPTPLERAAKLEQQLQEQQQRNQQLEEKLRNLTPEQLRALGIDFD